MKIRLNSTVNYDFVRISSEEFIQNQNRTYRRLWYHINIRSLPGDPGEYQHHQKATPGASAVLTHEEYDHLYQQKTEYDDDMMYKTTTKKTDAINDDDNNNREPPSPVAVPPTDVAMR